MTPVKTEWPRIIKELEAAGFSLYYIAKIFANDDRNKVKRWRDGKSKPDADEGPLILELHANVSHETRDAPSLSR